ncbi:MAG TPA: hypothetical protein DCR21_02570 [Succinivibrionaceae bacterium]|nr:hypothetical protein [Succinivibrionaceae bacterium]
MAKKKDEGGDDLETPKKGKGLLLLIIGLLLLIIVAVGGYFGVAYFMKLPPFEVKGPTPEEIAAKVAEKEAEQAARTRDIFVKFDKPFTFNLSGSKRQHTAQVEIVLMVAGEENEALAKQHLMMLNSTIFNALANQNYDALLRPSGRERLKNVLLDLTRAKMSEVAKNPVVEQVLFTGFVMQ